MNSKQEGLELATLGGGCFWCLEAVFEQLDGVHSVRSGYAGGDIADPSYQAVCNGTTGHAEVVQIRYDPVRLRFSQLLQVFFLIHDPTTLNRQGNDVGTQYRSVIFFHDDQQRVQALEAMAEAQTDRFEPVVTECEPLIQFYPAEDYHQHYYALHGHEPYCSLVIAPKVSKARRNFPHLWKT